MFQPTRLRLFAIAAAFSLAPAAFARDFRSADVHPTDYPTVEAVRSMGQSLKEQSKDRLGVKVFPSGAPGAPSATRSRQLKIGGLDMMRINAAPLNNIVAETIAVSLPFVFRSTPAHCAPCSMARSVTRSSRQWPSRALVGLAFYDSGFAPRSTPSSARSRPWPTSRG